MENVVVGIEYTGKEVIAVYGGTKFVMKATVVVTHTEGGKGFDNFYELNCSVRLQELSACIDFDEVTKLPDESEQNEYTLTAEALIELLEERRDEFL